MQVTLMGLIIANILINLIDWILATNGMDPLRAIDKPM